MHKLRSILFKHTFHKWGPVSRHFFFQLLPAESWEDCYYTVRLARARVSEWKRNRFEMDYTFWPRPIGQITFLFAGSCQLIIHEVNSFTPVLCPSVGVSREKTAGALWRATGVPHVFVFNWSHSACVWLTLWPLNYTIGVTSSSVWCVLQ